MADAAGDKPLCKFGEKCYRKNKEHLTEFRHKRKKSPIRPSTIQEKKELAENTLELDEGRNSIAEAPAENSSMKINDMVEFVLQQFHLHLPKDYFDFYNFCKELLPKNPLSAFTDELQLELVGPFHLMDKSEISVPAAHEWGLYYRYYHDPPEFITVLAATLNNPLHSHGFHIGYFRDDPSQTPMMVASGNLINGKLLLLGDNLFAAICTLMQDHKKTTLLKKTQEFAEAHGYSTKKTNPKLKDRNKKVVSKTFHELGLVVPVNEADVGYRELNVTNAELSRILNKIVSAPNEEQQMQAFEGLDDLVTCAQFANDEGDFGQSIELGLDLLAFHPTKAQLTKCDVFNKQIRNLLSVGYDLLSRSAFSNVIKLHMTNRSSDLPKAI